MLTKQHKKRAIIIYVNFSLLLLFGFFLMLKKTRVWFIVIIIIIINRFSFFLVVFPPSNDAYNAMFNDYDDDYYNGQSFFCFVYYRFGLPSLKVRRTFFFIIHFFVTLFFEPILRNLVHLVS